MEKYRVTLDAEERAALERLISAGKAASRRLAHARILLLWRMPSRARATVTRISSRPWARAHGPSPV
jgi:hypothetical protein